jgi:ABC-type branched-subunit amino acid transport system substrate-binding protein
MFYDPSLYRGLHIVVATCEYRQRDAIFPFSIQRVKSQGNDKILAINFTPSITTAKKIKL